MNQEFNHQEYVIRRKMLSVLGAKVHIYDGDGQLVLYSQMKAFKLKEEIMLYEDESMRSELLRIKVRKIIDLSATYDVTDGATGERIGALRRRGLKSILKDEWIILGPDDGERGTIKEENAFLAIIRRIIPYLPQSYLAEIDDQEAAAFRRSPNPFLSKVRIDFAQDTRERLDRRLGIAAGLLLCLIEGRQDTA
ncbi:hypothetical protein KIH86_01860 [Paenibacillus sp. HN-1]|uniref:hypothetical protein n=1 Tax=Paenibacillus TaxID=44249 RepID=UPI001CA8618E|nr:MULTISPECIES: hypothetical protein [Paenibacillus]MBY9080361.1 hypothetical protein [Paenibacillus sp. CGMCC 1.18879]MBY9082980.1 hypothetical protein [Paenibacillus sinensis]